MSTKLPNGGDTISIWRDVASPIPYDGAPEFTDVVVIGAGIAGLTVAYQLLCEGRSVTVVDDGPIGGGETGRTSAHLTSEIDDGYAKVEQLFGTHGARLVAQSHSAAIDYIERTVRELEIDCAFRRVDGYLFAPPGDRTDHAIEQEFAAARRAGIAVSRVSRAPLPFDTGPALRFEHQAEFHPLRYLRGLAQAVRLLGGKICTGIHVSRIEAGEPLRIGLSGGTHIGCNQCVDATNGALSSPVTLSIKQAAYRSYVIAYHIAPGTIPPGLYWDTADPYHYLRVVEGDDGGETLIVGGNDHRVGQARAELQWEALDRWSRKWLASASDIVTRWSGQVIEPADVLAHIGKSPDIDHVFVVTGDSGEGLTHATIAALLLPALMRGGEHAWAKIYDPSRSHLHALGVLVAEAAKSSAPYVDWIRPGEVASINEIAPGDGAVVRDGLRMLAAYRDETGGCHVRSATCPHLRGVVHWNAGEKTWDCPCHGSRFDAYGRVINGPAPTDLGPASPVAGQPAELPAPVSPSTSDRIEAI